MSDAHNDQPLQAVMDTTLARQIVEDGIRRFINTRRARIDDFVERNFSFSGSWDLNKRGFGLDIVKAPVNTLLVAPTLALAGASAAARKLNRPDLARKWSKKDLFLKTNVARELEWRIYTELFELPFVHDADPSLTFAGDALAREILCDPRLISQIEPMVMASAREAAKPGGRQWLDETLTAYLGSRAATMELSTLVMCLSTGGALTQQLTPGLISLGPAVSQAAQSAITAKSLAGAGFAAGTVPPAAAIAAGGTAALVVGASVLSAVSGAVTDPIQQKFGLHQRRLHQVLDLTEEAFIVGERAPFVVADQYVGRVMDLADITMALWHARLV